MDKPTQYICVSYMPLLTGNPGELDTLDQSNIKQTIAPLEKALEYGDAAACLWCRHNEQITPVFAMKRGREICEHLKSWSEDKPDDWFDLYIVRKKDRYAIVLFPRIEKSVDRFKEAQLIVNKTIIPTSAQIDILFRPLVFVSLSIGMYKKIQVGPSSHLGFVNEDDVDTKNVQETPEPIFVGPFNVKRHLDSPYLDSVFKVERQ